MFMSDETNLILTGHGLDSWAIVPDADETGPACNISIRWGGATDEEFLVRAEYAREVVDHLADALEGNRDADDVTVMSTPMLVADTGVDGTGDADDAYERRVVK